ncbi:MAG: hypothetical protein KZQ82_12145 [Candidatus Thiodiazotropha sp. (ex Lucinoma annulata)]|nr:hypothetical protein [Candidatus Thiodiazotropha sp. (ex Lucinoma annulata)]
MRLARQKMVAISEYEFLSIASEEQCGACLSERIDSLSPIYIRYTAHAKEFIEDNTFPTWRTNKDQTKYIGRYQTPPSEAFPISFPELSLRTKLFSGVNFDPNKDYFKTRNIISFYCVSCGVHVIKDGNHRLLQCAVQDYNPEIIIYEVASKDWTNCEVDMKNFCKCISNNYAIS